MKRTSTKYSIYFLLLLAVSVFYFNCGSDNPVTTTPGGNTEGTTQSLTSDNQGNITFDGFRML